MSEPRTRIRISHPRTVKDGFSHETTVEIEYDGDRAHDPDALARLEGLLIEVDRLGRAEADRRNREDGR